MPNVMPVMLTRFVCDLLVFHALEFPAKPQTRELGRYIMGWTSYTNKVNVTENNGVIIGNNQIRTYQKIQSYRHRTPDVAGI